MEYLETLITWRKVRSKITPEFQRAWIVIGVRRLRVWAYDNPKKVPRYRIYVSSNMKFNSNPTREIMQKGHYVFLPFLWGVKIVITWFSLKCPTVIYLPYSNSRTYWKMDAYTTDKRFLALTFINLSNNYMFLVYRWTFTRNGGLPYKNSSTYPIFEAFHIKQHAPCI